MLNFEAELDKLLSRETGALPQYEFEEIAAVGQEFLTELTKKQTDISLQIEEIYDLVKEQDTRYLREAMDAEKTRANHLVFAAISLSDLLEDFYAYAKQSGSEELKHQAKLMWENAAGILSGRGIFRFGEEGQFLNPQIHTVKASVESPLPRERVVQVLQSGYLYQNVLLRKAAVVISRGQEDAVRETETETEDAGIRAWEEDGINDEDDTGDEDEADGVNDEDNADGDGDEADGVNDEDNAGNEDEIRNQDNISDSDPGDEGQGEWAG